MHPFQLFFAVACQDSDGLGAVASQAGHRGADQPVNNERHLMNACKTYLNSPQMKL
jgi:hypothetical protein